MSSENKGKVGYRVPPKETQFKPGRSGNPSGRKKGSVNLKTSIIKQMNKTIELLGADGSLRKTTMRDALAEMLVAKAVSGDLQAAQLLMKILSGQLLAYDKDFTMEHPISAAEEAAKLNSSGLLF